MDEDLANLNISDDDEEIIEGQSINEKEDEEYELCLIGKVLTESVVHSPSMIRTLAEAWHPVSGISITDLGEKRSLFRFYHEIDIKRVLRGTLWFFNRHLVLLHRLEKGEQPLQVPLISTKFWVQIHNLLGGFKSEGMAPQLGDFSEKFIEYDVGLITKGIKKLRVRVKLDVRRPLKIKKRIAIGQNKTIYAMFKYEKLFLFCYLCGRLGHGEGFCPAEDCKWLKEDRSVSKSILEGQLKGKSFAEGQLGGTEELPISVNQNNNRGQERI
ncbi:hypothetical protein GOBAR_AA19412 [Gossypium barbadense]|uniref:CCHC-type domain-containing protein n=1 Tax=Gossypium barbadense TaxID=3634 RepID=A0A2P5XD60_GOSBA|nr:hypothetical protein GOBAR_AA19412 [Gossypium barbadense]